MLYVFSLLRSLASSLVRFSGVLAEPSCRCRMVGANPTVGDEVFATSRTKKDYGGWGCSPLGASPVRETGKQTKFSTDDYVFTADFSFFHQCGKA